MEPTRAEVPAAPGGVVTGRVLTVPNVISFARLLGVPLFLYLLLGPRLDVAAVVVLVVGGTSDWVDGYVARRMGQVSRLGTLLDPLADRLYIFATVLAFTVREVVPLWFAVALVVREALLGVCLLILRRHGYGVPPVHYVGKTATFLLLAAFPVLLIAHASDAAAPIAGAAGWSLAWWGIVLYWVAAGFYVVQVAQLIRAVRLRRGDR